MDYYLRTLVYLSLGLLMGCQTPVRAVATDSHAHAVETLPPGGRKGLHGMVVFGSHGSYFMEHIPMLTPPHDFQILTTVSLKDQAGQPLKNDFSKTGFTLKPASNFSLNDFIEGRLTKFNGSIFRGSFEQEGKVVEGLENVQIEVTKMHFNRHLPSESSEEFFEVSDGENSYQTTLITSENNFQKIINKNLKMSLWCVTGPDFFEFCK